MCTSLYAHIGKYVHMCTAYMQARVSTLTQFSLRNRIGSRTCGYQNPQMPKPPYKMV